MIKNYFDTNEKSFCCGCKVCSSVCPVEAISLQNDEEGFWYPTIDESKCIKCNKCRNVCPLSKAEIEKIKEENQTYAVYSKVKEVLDNSTSGGIFTHISDIILDEGGVVFGHAYDETLKCICKIARTKEERNTFRGSKYVQSDMNSVYEEIKNEVKIGKKVLVTGTPCQIDAVKNYFLNKIPDNLFTMDIVCHGVPSPQIFSEYVVLQEKISGKKIKDFKFRDKKKGWTTPFRVFEYTDGYILPLTVHNNTEVAVKLTCVAVERIVRSRFEDDRTWLVCVRATTAEAVITEAETEVPTEATTEAPTEEITTEAETEAPTEEVTTEAETEIPESGMDHGIERDGTPKKYFTIRFDDGITQDERVMEILRKYNADCCTFYINTGLYGANWAWVGQHF